jgi:hypothetical protein
MGIFWKKKTNSASKASENSNSCPAIGYEDKDESSNAVAVFALG